MNNPMNRGFAPPANGQNGRILNRVVTVTVTDQKNGKAADFLEKRTFLTNALVTRISEERSSAEFGPYRSINVAVAGALVKVMCYGELRHFATRLRTGRYYSFEGTARYTRSNQNNGSLVCFLTLQTVTNADLSVADASVEAEVAETEPETEMAPAF